MFLRCASLGLLVVLGAAVVLCSPINPVSPAMDKTHKYIANRLKLTQPVVGSNPLFSSVIGSINNSCQEEVMLMNATLDVYMRIFSRILHHQENTVLDQVPPTELPHVQTALKDLWERMDKLKTNLGHLQQNKKALLNEINAIKVDDPLVQKKALAEFLEVYHTASALRDSGH